jgi:hypothetical protein
MKYATPMLGLTILMASVVATVAADPVVLCDLCKSLQRMPTQYRGTWCFIHRGNTASVYKRCPHKNKDGMEITSAFPIIDGIEDRNTITYVGTYPAGAPGLLLQGKYITADQPDEPIEWRWSLFGDGQYLLWE